MIKHKKSIHGTNCDLVVDVLRENPSPAPIDPTRGVQIEWPRKKKQPIPAPKVKAKDGKSPQEIADMRASMARWKATGSSNRTQCPDCGRIRVKEKRK